MKANLSNFMYEIMGFGAMIIVMFAIFFKSLKTSFLKLFLVLTTVSVFATSCITGWNLVVGSGEILTETVNIEDEFTSVELQSYADVIIEKGTEFNVEISDYENLIEYMDVKVSNGKLIVKTYPVYMSITNTKATVVITMPDALNSILISGSGDVVVNDAFNNLKVLKVSGSGDILLETDSQYENLKAMISGSGRIYAFGTVGELETMISGSGYIRFEELIAQSADCSISGSGNTYVNVVNTLDAYISGSGSVIYTGNPSVNSQVSGSGRVRKG